MLHVKASGQSCFLTAHSSRAQRGAQLQRLCLRHRPRRLRRPPAAHQVHRTAHLRRRERPEVRCVLGLGVRVRESLGLGLGPGLGPSMLCSRSHTSPHKAGHDSCHCEPELSEQWPCHAGRQLDCASSSHASHRALVAVLVGQSCTGRICGRSCHGRMLAMLICIMPIRGGASAQFRQHAWLHDVDKM